MHKQEVYLDSLKLSLFYAELTSPRNLGLGKGLDTRLELVDLLPSIVKLSAHVIQPLRKPAFDLFGPFVKVKLNLTESLEPSNEIVMEDTEVGERLRFSLPALLLLNISPENTKTKRLTYRCLIHSKDLVHVLIDRQQQGIPLSELIPILTLRRQQRSLILRKPLLKIRHLGPIRNHLPLSSPQAPLDIIQLLRNVQPRLGLRCQLTCQVPVLDM